MFPKLMHNEIYPSSLYVRYHPHELLAIPLRHPIFRLDLLSRGDAVFEVLQLSC